MVNEASIIHEAKTASTITIKGILSLLMQSVDGNDGDKRVISLAMGVPTIHTCFHTTNVVQEPIVDTLQYHKFNGYAPTVGLLQTRSV
ncbi:hypothetical protein QN277_014333 [Acacia crassicarpa]|uniref:Uncharacterized protein n=1 Tax=Acacia crassicarpa TaxID=499986 RepID=A0AAE1MAR1_9FABA|nr:hypothetical protein QN277_014333 [Acacia crassicarpa]